MSRSNVHSRLPEISTDPPGRGPSPALAGVTLIEILIGLTIFAIAAMSVMSVMVYSMRLDAANKETAVATQAARRVMERIKATPFDRVVADFNADPKDDPDGEGFSPGADFAVPDLREVHEEVKKVAGEILLPSDKTGKLREDLDLPILGLPRDLNGDGKIDKKDHTDDLRALPVIVRIRWTGFTGPRSVELHSVIRK
ncbi:MAG: type IV pilus modification PilV family protein [Planctomycetota bacterium]|jgi:prepilin-type N-terminal cleavage/methylation domain-containing protein